MIVDNLDFHIRRTGDSAAGGVGNLSRTMAKLKKSSETATKSTNKFLSSLKRIAGYRILRTIIKEIGKAFEEGLKNAYQFSSTINGQLSQTMDNIASIGLQMKNQLGSAFGELLMNLEPIITAIENVIIRVADAISRLLAVLGGRSTYNKAIASTEKWAKATGAGAKAAKEWKNQLMGFDEINRLEEPSDSNGGGGAGADGIGNWEEAPATMKWAEELKKITSDWLSTVNFEPFIQSWGRLKEAVGKFVELVDGALKWVYINVLLPLAKWAIEEGGPATVNMLASALEFLNAVLEKLAPAWQQFWDETLQPFLAWVGEKLVAGLEWVTKQFESMTEKVKKANTLKEFLDSLNGDEQIVLGIAIAIGIVALSLAPIPVAIAAVTAACAWLWKEWDKVTAKVDEWKEAFRPVGEWLDTYIIQPLNTVISKLREFWSWLTGNQNVTRTEPITSAPSYHGSGGFYASGGFPDEGQMFMAREAGPELVGTIGSKTAVANNDQIVEGIESGVRDANEDVVNAIFAVSSQIINAMRESDRGGRTDWNAVAKQVTRYQRMQSASANV